MGSTLFAKPAYVRATRDMLGMEFNVHVGIPNVFFCRFCQYLSSFPIVIVAY